jgi:hypothetical protein
LSGSVHPEDLSQLTVQFRRGRSDFSVFRLRIGTPDGTQSFDFFTPCLVAQGDGCRYLLSGTLWNAARAELVGKPAVLTVSGATGASGTIKSSEPLPLSVSNSSLIDKGFYYWTSVPLYSGIPGDQETGIFRLPFGADRAEPFIMPNTKTNDRQCGACHSVSRDGSTIAFTARDYDTDEMDQRSGVLVTARTARPEEHFIEPPADATYDSSMMALSSDGRRVLVAYDDRLVLRSATDADAAFPKGAEIASLTRADLDDKIGYFPEFSRDDDALVLTLSDQPDSAIAVQAGDIAVIDVDLAKGTFGAPRVVVEGTDEEFHFYPTWSPDAQFIAFASAPRGIGEDGYPRKSYDQKKARLRLVRREGGEVYELKNATYELDKWSTFPKFAPFSAEEQGGLMFLTFNSKIDYGLVLDNASLDDEDKRAQLWMSALDVTKLPADPSSTPIWLPFQDAGQSSHLGIWTSDVKCRTDVGTLPPCDIGQRCDDITKTCKVIVK